MIVGEDSEPDRDALIRVTQLLHLQLDLFKLDCRVPLHWLASEHFLKDVLVLQGRTLDLVDGLAVEGTEAEKGRRLVLQTHGGNLKLHLVIGLFNRLCAHDDHAPLFSLARYQNRFGDCLPLRSHD